MARPRQYLPANRRGVAAVLLGSSAAGATKCLVWERVWRAPVCALLELGEGKLRVCPVMTSPHVCVCVLA